MRYSARTVFCERRKGVLAGVQGGTRVMTTTSPPPPPPPTTTTTRSTTALEY